MISSYVSNSKEVIETERAYLHIELQIWKMSKKTELNGPKGNMKIPKEDDSWKKPEL